MVSNVELSLDLLMVMLPEPIDTFSEKTRARLVVFETSVAPSDGV